MSDEEQEPEQEIEETPEESTESAGSDDIEAKINTALDQVRQYLRVDGGDIQLVSYNDGEVAVRLQGHCAGCVHAQATLRNLVEQSLKEMLGEELIQKVVAVA